MDILQYLIELLKTRKQVGIEGLGTLYKKKTPGRYDAETHSFLPPSYVLDFTSDILENSNLVKYIQNKRSISEDSARYFVGQFAEEIKKGLAQGEYNLEHLGTFSLVDDQLSFTPSQQINVGFDFFALPAVTADIQQPETQTSDKEETISNEHSDEAMAEISDISTETPPPLTEEPKIEQVKVPEFEQEMERLDERPSEQPEVTQTEEEEKVEPEEIEQEELPEQELSEVSDEPTIPVIPSVERNLQHNDTEPTDNREQNEEPENIAEETVTEEVDNEEQSASVEEPSETEVYDEIAEINPENPTNEPTNGTEDKQWDFDNEDVVSSTDVYQENESKESNNTFFNNEDQDIKLTSTTHEWDFDSANENSNTSISDFDNDEIQNLAEEEKRKTPFSTLSWKLIIGLLIIIALAAIAYFVKPEIFGNLGKNATILNKKIAAPIETNNLKTQQDSLDFADSIMKNAEKAGLEVQPAKDTLEVITTKTEVKPTITYDIIVAAIARQSEAEEYISHMKKKGFEAKIANMPGKIYKKISIASYNNIDSAEKYVVKFRKQFKNPKIYVQRIKNN